MDRTEEALETATQALRLKTAVADEHLTGVGTASAVAGHYEEALTPLKKFLTFRLLGLGSLYIAERHSPSF